MNDDTEDLTQVTPERAEAISREDIRRGIIKGARIIREGAELARLGWKTSREGWDGCADWVVDNFLLPRDHRRYDN